MIHEYKLPSLGDGVTGKVTDILVKPGDQVTKEQIVMVVGTDKVDAEMPVDAEGTVQEILVKKGDDVTEGTVVLRLETANGAAAATPTTPAAQMAAGASPEVAQQATQSAAVAAERPQEVSAAGVSAYEFKLPGIGDGVTGKVTEINVQPGDRVSSGQIVLVVATDKVDAEMPIDVGGVVEEVLVKKGDDVTEGTVVMRLKTEGAPGASATRPAEASPANAGTTSAPTTPTAAANQPFMPGQGAASKEAAAPAAPAPSTGEKGSRRASPLARKRAKEFGVNIDDVRAADGGNRISYKDVLEHVKTRIDKGGGAAAGTATGVAGMAHKKLPSFEKFGSVERQPLSRIGQLTADNMTYAFNAIPHAWISEKADITKLEALRQQHKDAVKAKGGALTTTAILTKALCAVLRKMPQFNASLDTETNEVVYKKFINIGIAVDTPRGLLVPVIRNADQKGLVDISIELSELSTRTRDGKNKIDDLDGGTFSISNIGGIGGTNMISIVNWPQVAILSVTAASMEPHWNGTAFEPRLMMPMTIGWDHRVINGADAARFLQELKAILEEPFLGWF